MKSLTELYTQADMDLMKTAEISRMPGKNKVEEIKNFARNAGLKKIGIANCISMQKETDVLKTLLGNEFEVHSIDCKCGKIPSSEFTPNAKGISCNPAGQADYLAEQSTELNISLGLCMGHDIVFNAKSKAPVTTLVVKDREHNHNSIITLRNQ